MSANPSKFSPGQCSGDVLCSWSAASPVPQMRSVVSASPNSSALAVIMKCSAEAYVSPSTVNAAGRH